MSGLYIMIFKGLLLQNLLSKLPRRWRLKPALVLTCVLLVFQESTML